MIKIMHIISDTNIGGAGKWVITYCQNRDRENFDVSVVIPKGSLLKKELYETCVNIIEIDGLKDRSLDVMAISKLKKIIKEEKPDIVHTHASLSARIAARSCENVKIVYTKHCVFPPSKIYKYDFVKRLNGTFNRKYADKIIATAEVAKRDLIAQGNNEEDIEVVLNATNGFKRYANFRINEVKEKYNIRMGDVVVCMLARVEELKGYKYYVEAAKILVEENPKYKFLVVGTGSYENELKEYVKKIGVEDNVIFTGFISNVEEILNIVDVQVNASYISETTNISLLEGMSLGIPTVATDCGGTSKMIRNGENGILVRKENAEDIANGIKYLLEDEERLEKIRNNSIEIFNNEYKADKFARAIENVYKGMVNDNEIIGK